MLTSAIIATRTEVSRWHGAVRQHAAWLGLTASVSHHAIGDQTSMAVARLTSGHESPWTSCDTTELAIDLATGDVAATIPAAGPQALYVYETRDALVLSDDLRLMAWIADLEPDPAGVFALLRHGFIPAPFTLFQGVRRLPGGCDVRINATTRRIEIVPLSLSSAATRARYLPDDPARWLLQSIDRALEDVPARAELYFSGGVDSSLLAARLLRLGRTDVRFVHYSFGPDDRETVQARRVAHALGIALDEVVQTDHDVDAIAGRIARDYTHPFGDASVIPSSALAHATIDRREPPAAVIEGTGADGSFAVPCSFRAWRALYTVPMPIRRAIGDWYRRRELWRRHAPVARWCQTIRRSAQLPLEQAALANALDGIAYVTPPQVDVALRAAFDGALDTLFGDGPPDARLGLFDVMFGCAGAMAQKTFDPLRSRGVRPVYPYLSPPIVLGAALLPASGKCRRGEPKALLKSALARAIPPPLVYRPKQGFTPPYQRLFSSAPMERLIHDNVLTPGNRLLDFCRADVVRGMAEQASRGRLNTGGCDFLWTLAFSSTWLAGLRDRVHTAGRVHPVAFESCAASPVL